MSRVTCHRRVRASRTRFSTSAFFNKHLREWLVRSPIKLEVVAADEIIISGAMFDPHQHFGEWRKRQYD